MSEDFKSVKANSEDSKSDTTDPILSDSENKEEDAGNDTMSKDSSSDTSEEESIQSNQSITEEEKKDIISLSLELLQVFQSKYAETETETETEHYPAGFLKQGMIQGISYQLKVLTWTAWNLFKNKQLFNNWELAAEVRDARGFHDLVVKYNMKTDSKTEESTSKYRFMQIKHTSSKHPIDKKHLSSTETFDRQYSLVYLFMAYLDMLQSFKDDQIMDLTLFTNKSIYKFPFLVPIEEDTISGFKKKGQRYRVDIKAINSNSKIMKCLKKIKDDDVRIKTFLNKLIFAVNQPTEAELEELIVNDMEENLKFMGPIFYTYLFKNIFDWFLLYDVQQKTSSYYTRDRMVGLFHIYHDALGKVIDAAKENPLLSCLLS